MKILQKYLIDKVFSKCHCVGVFNVNGRRKNTLFSSNFDAPIGLDFLKEPTSTLCKRVNKDKPGDKTFFLKT